MPQTPFIYFAFANSTTNYLPNLKQEERDILSHFTPLKHTSKLADFEHREQTSSKDLFDIFNAVGPKINIFHYSGHAGSMKLGLDDHAYSVQRLCNTIAAANNIQLVFLNGCATHDMVDSLLKAGVKAVIATSEKVLDNKACDFSLSFYQAFTIPGRPLNEAFQLAVSTLNGDNLQSDVKVVSRSLGFENPETGTVSWGLYHREDSSEILNWALIEAQKSSALASGIAKQIRNLVANNRIKQAFEILLNSNLEEDLNMAVIQQSQKWKDLKRKEMLGVISSSNAGVSRSQIVYAILNIVEEVG